MSNGDTPKPSQVIADAIFTRRIAALHEAREYHKAGQIKGNPKPETVVNTARLFEQYLNEPSA